MKKKYMKYICSMKGIHIHVVPSCAGWNTTGGMTVQGCPSQKRGAVLSFDRYSMDSAGVVTFKAR
jgi:hypothetical protein